MMTLFALSRGFGFQHFFGLGFFLVFVLDGTWIKRN
jgi:hypothetical protein